MQQTSNQDTHMGRLTVGAVFSNEEDGFKPSILGTVPSTGTAVQMVTNEILNGLLGRYAAQLFYLGAVYGSKTRLPLIFQQFASGETGADEAYHIGIFGKTGSGKSTLAKMILLGYARHPEMAIFVIDPVGEFSRNALGQLGTESFRLNLREVLDRLGKQVVVVRVRDLIMDRWNLFSEILQESPFFDRLIPRQSVENRRLASDILAEELQERNVTLAELHTRPAFDRAMDILSDPNIQIQFYRTGSSRERFDNVIRTINRDQLFRSWCPITQLFRTDRPNVISADALVAQAFDLTTPNRPIVIIDISREENAGAILFWNDTIQALMINRILDGLNRLGLEAYRSNRFLNTLVILDEAQRLARGEKMENEKQEKVRKHLLDAVDTTRKYGLGWMFISTSLSGIDQNIVRQMRIRFVGYGLALGSELSSLKELVGEASALKLYQTFRDPHSVFERESREYSFMATGPVSPLASSIIPLFLTAFSTAEEFLNINNLANEPETEAE